MHSTRIDHAPRYGLTALICAVALSAAGCHRNNLNSGYGVTWVTLTNSPGAFTSYVVNVNSITFTRSDGTPVGTNLGVERVDFAQLGNVAELWGAATISTGTYTSASLVLDYTNAVISVMVNGVPVKATVVDSTGKAVTTQTINVIFDPAAQPTIVPTYASTSAQRVAIAVNLGASTVSINQATSPYTVTVRPYVTMGVAPADNKPIRVRGPLINSSVGLGTYTVYVRPFYDEVDSFGSLSLFVDASTIYTLNGAVYQGTNGITQLSQASAGTTLTAAYATFEPTTTPSATAGIFHAKYVIAGSSLEDNASQGLEGDVVARNGNTLTVRGSTQQLTYVTTGNNAATYNTVDATVIVGPSTFVTADNTTLTNLDYHSVAVGQHIVARGLYSAPTAGAVQLDATSTASANTGSVRLIGTQLYGSVVASGAGALSMNLTNINNWPVSSFTFTGNGTSAAADPVPAAFAVNTGTLVVPTLNAGDPVWVSGLVAPFGAAPPDFSASAVYNELGVQTVGAAAGGLTCAQGVFDCLPASLQVTWSGTGTGAPFTALTAAGMTLDLGNAALSSAVISIGPENIDLKAAGVSPQIVPQSGTGTAGLPAVFSPLFTYGNPTVYLNPATTTAGGINVFGSFATFVTGLPAALAAAPALQLTAQGTYDRTTNTFSAIGIDVVL